MTAALSAPAAASPNGYTSVNLHTYNTTEEVESFTESYTAGKDASKEKNGVVGMAIVKSTSETVAGGDVNEDGVNNFHGSLTLDRDGKAVPAVAVLINNVSTTFTGNETVISLSAKNGGEDEEDLDSDNHALLVQGYEQESSATIDMTKRPVVKLQATHTTISTEDTASKMESDATGFELKGNSRGELTGTKVGINATGTAYANGIQLNNAYVAKDSGKTKATANLYVGADTTLTIEVNGTCETAPTVTDKNTYLSDGTSAVMGVYAEGGEIYAEGKTNVKATAKAGGAFGMMLFGMGADQKELTTTLGQSLSYNHTSTYNDDLTINVSSDTGRAAGVLLGGIVDEDSTGKPDSVTRLQVKDMTVNVTKGTNNQYDTDGILFVDTKLGGSPELLVKGTVTITADNALRSAYWDSVEDFHEGEGEVTSKVYVENGANLTLNGNVSQYKGQFIQNGGTVVVNTKNSQFFGGAVQISGGKLTAENADWSVAAKSVISGGEVTLGNVEVSGNQLQLTGGKLSAKSFSLNKGTIEGDAEITLFGGDEDESVIKGGTLKVKSLTLDGRNGKGLDDGAFIDVHDGSKLGSKLIVTGDLKLTDKTVLSGSAATVHAKNLILEKGSWYYDQKLNETREFQVSDGVLTLRGGQLITSVDGKETESADKAARIESLLLKKGENPVFSSTSVAAYIEAGTYDFAKGITLADADSEMRIKGSSVVNAGALAVKGGTFTIGAANSTDAPKLTVKTITIAEGAKMKLVSGTLSTTTDQIFTNGLDVDGKTLDAGEQIYGSTKLDLTGGTLAFSDAYYNEIYKQSAVKALGDNAKTIIFNGQRVDVRAVSIDEIGDNAANVVESNVTVKVDVAGAARIEKSFGVSKIEVTDKVTSVSFEGQSSAQKVIKLVGSSYAAGELISGGQSGTTVDVGAYATLQLGEEGSANNQGKISKALTVAENGTLAVNEGNFTLTNVTATKGAVNIDAGKVTFDKLTSDEGSIKINDGASVEVSSLTLKGQSKIVAGKNLEVTELKVDNSGPDKVSHEITGAMTIGELAVSGDETATLNIGTEGEDGARGDLTLKGDSLKGLSFFLDPAYVNGQTIADGSRLVFAGNTIDGKIAVGQNSYVVLGGTDDSNITAAFNSGKVKWGNADGAVLAAAYVAKPITIDKTKGGGLFVDGTKTSAPTVAAGSVTFAKNSALVADVTNVTDGAAMIKADSVKVEVGSKAVLVGTLHQGTTYMLTSDEDQNKNWADNLVAGNALWKLTMNGEGKVVAKLTDAAIIFGSSMQGTALANAGMAADSAYVNALLTDETGDIANRPEVAARFDAAMNPAGALTTFTTAYDRASELRQIVRDETAAADGDNRLWVHVTGGKTKLKGISTGGQDLHTKTTAYGIVVGGEAALTNGKLGFALTAGTGDTKNNSVSAKDEFNYYGASVYGKTKAGSVDILADASATFVKSDLTVGGVADVDTDVTTSVYSFGVQGRKTFELAAADVTPFIGMDVYHVRGGSYSNGHGAHVQSSNATAVEFPVGAEVSKAFATASGLSVKPAFSLAVVPTVADRDIDSKVKMAGASSTYNFTFADDVKVRTKLGIEAQKANFTFGLQAGYEWGNEERSSANIEARMKYCF